MSGLGLCAVASAIYLPRHRECNRAAEWRAAPTLQKTHHLLGLTARGWGWNLWAGVFRLTRSRRDRKWGNCSASKGASDRRTGLVPGGARPAVAELTQFR